MLFDNLMPKHREIWEHDSLASFIPIGQESNTSRCCTTVALGSRDWDLRVILDQASKIVLVGICHSHLARLVPPRPNCQLPNILGSPWVPSIVVRGLHYRCTQGAPRFPFLYPQTRRSPGGLVPHVTLIHFMGKHQLSFLGGLISRLRLSIQYINVVKKFHC